jgi:lipopolysaccharide transport system permease protein
MDGSLAHPLDYFKRIWCLRYFWFSLVQKDIQHRYRRSFLGILWSLIRPLALTCVLCLVFSKLFHLELSEYAPYLLLGMLTWQFFTECVLQGCNSFGLGSAYIRQQRIPLAIFPLRTVMVAGFHALIAIVMALFVAWFFRGSIHVPALLCLIPAVAYFFVLGWCLAILTGLMNTHFPDMNHMLEIGLQILFYATPILYQPSAIQDRTRMSMVIEWNPLTSVLALVRTPILDGGAPEARHILISLLFLAFVACTALALLRKLERTLIFWI